MAALSFEINDAACDAFAGAFDQFLKRRAALFATDATSLRRARG
jgi:glutamate-1-semialdehyde 2,1-aminomutase